MAFIIWRTVAGLALSEKMGAPMPNTSKQLSPRTIMAGTFIISFLPFLMVLLLPSELDRVMEKSSYLIFHNVAEFFSIMVSLCVFSVGWYTYDQSKDQRALLLGTAFLAVGLLDFMHTLSNAAMPAFITPNSTNKSTQFWIAARLLDASIFLASAFVNPEMHRRSISRTTMMSGAVA
ncbi:MAG: signal transduction histidine kinase, partial [uncultured bacterium]